MPDYIVTHPTTGKTVTITGDSPPSEAELDGIFAATAATAPTKTRDQFIAETAATPTRIKEGALALARKASPYIRPLLEGGGAIGGGALATPETLGLGTIPGVALGYAAGKNVADQMDEGLGLKKPESLLQRFATTGNDLATGATMEMGGQLAGKAIGAGLGRFAKAKAEGVLPFTPKSNTAKAAKIWEDVSTSSPVAAEANAARQQDANSLLDRVGATTDLTPAQATGNLKTAGFEQAVAAKDPVLMERLKYNDAQLHGGAQANMTKALGPVSAPMPVTPANGQAVGASIDSAIGAAREPVLAAERAAWDAVPNYAMPHDNFLAAGAQLSQTPMVKSAEDAVNGVLSFAEKMPKTVQGLQSIERTIGSEIGKATKAGDNETARALGILKSSIGADFDVMSAAAANGDIALHNGTVVFPSKIQAELDGVKRQMVFPQGGGMPTAGETSGLQSRTAQLTDQLANLQPAEDVAQAYTAAKQLSKVEKFDRFDRGAVKAVMAKGDEATGRRLPAEAIPAQMFTPRGSADLVRALSPMQGAGMTAAQSRALGIQAAGQQMTPHVMERLSAARIIDADGVMDIPRAMAFVRQNKETLNNLGMTKQMQGVIKDQIPGSVKATLERMADKGVDVLGNPTMTARQSAKMWRDYAPAWKAAGGDMKALTAMKDYHTMITMLGRNKGVSYSGNSTSVEKLFGDAPPESLAGKMMQNLSNTLTGKALAGGGAGYVVGGPVGAGIGSVAGVAIQSAQQHSAQAVKALLKDAITNPETAKMLMDVARGLKVPAQEIDRYLGTLGMYAVESTTHRLSDPLGIRK